MKVIKGDHDRRLEIPGVANLVRRPVDIDKSNTGFANLRSLRIYRFDAGSVINGHAEEDEVLIMLLAGSVELTMSANDSMEDASPVFLSAPDGLGSNLCAAYLPPHAAYRLIPKVDADVAYARATPVDGRPPIAFSPSVASHPAAVTVLLKEETYARLLRLRLLRVDARQNEVAFPLLEDSELRCEALVHLRPVSSEGVATITAADRTVTALEAWDTVAVSPGEHFVFNFAKGSSAFLVVSASEL